MKFKVRTLLKIGLVAAVWTFAAPAGAIITGGGCVDEVSGTNNNCTANDVTFVVVGLGEQDDGCVSPSDTVSILLGGTLRNTTAQTRYDIGMYIATDGDPNGDGAKTGTCAREILQPVGTQGVTTCGSNALDLLREFPTSDPDNGPYLNTDGDTCGDLFAQGNSGCDQDADGQWDDSIIQFTEALTFPCDDVDANGFIEIPTCATWGNQSGQVGSPTCDSEVEVVPGTKSKCRCEVIDSTIPAPNLGLSCSSPSQSLGPDETGTFSVTYTNSNTCTPDGTKPEREQCGTASYVFYVVDYDETKGSVSNITVGSGSFTHDTTAGTITWIPASSRNGTSGIIGPSDSAGLSYDYTYTANQASDTVSSSTTTYWTNDAADLGDPTATSVTSQAVVGCNSSVSATPVTLSSVEVGRGADGRVLRWTTATETAHLGFNVYGDGADGWQQLNDRVVVSAPGDSTVPRSYSFDLSGTSARRFMLEDVALDGSTTLHGPFEAGSVHGGQPKAEPVDWAGVRAEVAAEPPAAASLTRRAGRGAGGGRPAAPGRSDAPTARLLVDTDGVHRVTYEDLLDAGLDFDGAPASQLALTRGGEPVPIRVESPRGTFGPGGFVEFLGEAVDSLYTRTSVYELTRDPHTASRIPEDRTKARPGTPVETYRALLDIERDLAYSFTSPGDDPWYDTQMLAFASPRSWEFDVDLDGRAAGQGPVDLAVELWGVTTWPEEGDHHAVVRWNGASVADAVWDGQTARILEATVPGNLVESGGNTLTVELPADRGVPWDVIQLESIAVEYPRRLEARDGRLTFEAAGELLRVRTPSDGEPVVYRVGSGGPVRVTDVRSDQEPGGGTVLSFPGESGTPATYHLADSTTVLRPGVETGREPAGLLDGPAEYLVISHAAFLDGLGPLVDVREADGLAVKVVDVADVYDRYSDGVFDPEAIRDYIAEAAATLGTRYVLLVGGDTFDYHDRLGRGSVSFIPSLYAATGPLVRYAPVDPLYTDLDGDRVPDLPIGRLPVRTRAELDAVVDKIVRYENKGYDRTALMTADVRDGSSGFSFSQAAERMVADLPAGWSVERAYLDNLSPGAARQKLVRGLNEGAALTTFVGHSGLTHWTFANLFRAGDVQGLESSDAPTVVVQWGCWNTYHVEPRFQTLGHRFLLTPDKGAAAVLGSATLLATSSADALSERLFPRLARPGVTLGQAVTAAKQELAASEPERVDAILGWTLLGDPALMVDP